MRRDSIWDSISTGAFADVKRTRTGAQRGHAGVVPREPDFALNPILDALEGKIAVTVLAARPRAAPVLLQATLKVPGGEQCQGRPPNVTAWLACGALWGLGDRVRESLHADPSPLPDAALAGPHLTSLAVSGAPGSLVPSFSPGVYDYYVRCAAGTNALTVSMTASSGAKGSLVQPKASTPSRRSRRSR